MNRLRCACLAGRGSLKQFTETPPVLDRFKKWFLYGINGEASLYNFVRVKVELGQYQSGQRQLVLGNSGEVIALVVKLIGVLIPHLEFSRVPFGIDNSEQNRDDGFVFIDKSSIGLGLVRLLQLNLQSGDRLCFPLPLFPRPQVLAWF